MHEALRQGGALRVQGTGRRPVWPEHSGQQGCRREGRETSLGLVTQGLVAMGRSLGFCPRRPEKERNDLCFQKLSLAAGWRRDPRTSMEVRAQRSCAARIRDEGAGNGKGRGKYIDSGWTLEVELTRHADGRLMERGRWRHQGCLQEQGGSMSLSLRQCFPTVGDFAP